MLYMIGQTYVLVYEALLYGKSNVHFKDCEHIHVLGLVIVFVSPQVYLALDSPEYPVSGIGKLWIHPGVSWVLDWKG